MTWIKEMERAKRWRMEERGGGGKGKRKETRGRSRKMEEGGQGEGVRGIRE